MGWTLLLAIIAAIPSRFSTCWYPTERDAINRILYLRYGSSISCQGTPGIRTVYHQHVIQSVDDFTLKSTKIYDLKKPKLLLARET